MKSAAARPRDNGPMALGDLVKAVVRREGLLIGAGAAGGRRQGARWRVAEAWRRVVGAETAAHAWVTAWRAGTVTVVVDSPALHMELASTRGPALVAALRRELGEGPEPGTAPMARRGRGSAAPFVEKIVWRVTDPEHVTDGPQASAGRARRGGQDRG